jgi:hypothetical protein
LRSELNEPAPPSYQERLAEKWLKRSPDGALLLTSTPKQGFYAPFFDRGPPRFEAVEAFRTVSEEVFSETELPVLDILGN